MLLVPHSWGITEGARRAEVQGSQRAPVRKQLTLPVVHLSAPSWVAPVGFPRSLVQVLEQVECLQGISWQACVAQRTRRGSPHSLSSVDFPCRHFWTLTVFLLPQSPGNWGVGCYVLHLRNLFAVFVTALGMSARNAGSQLSAQLWGCASICSKTQSSIAFSVIESWTLVISETFDHILKTNNSAQNIFLWGG